MKVEIEVSRCDPCWSDWQRENPQLYEWSQKIRMIISARVAPMADYHKAHGAIMRGILLAYADFTLRTLPEGMLLTKIEESHLDALSNAFAQSRIDCGDYPT